MRYSKLIDALQNLIEFKPTHKQLGEILGIGASAIGNRVAKDGDFSDDEIEKIEHQYGISLREEIIPQDLFEADYYTDIFGSCGGGAFVLPEITQKVYLSKSSITDYAQFKEYFVINAIGDSMIPFIQDRDRLVIEKYNDEQIRDNRIYLFCYDDKIFIKRLVYNINELIIKSDNEQYSAITLKKEQLDNFKIIGQIVGIMRDVR